MGRTRPPTDAERRKRYETLNERQKDVLGCIRRHLREHKRPPTRGELARDVAGGLTPSAIDHHLQQLALRKWIELTPGVQRGIRLLREGTPLVSASELDADDYVDHHGSRIETIEDLLGATPDVFVRLEDNSMGEKAGLRAGDLIAVVREHEPQHGDLVLAKTDQGLDIAPFEDRAPGGDGSHGGSTHAIGVVVAYITLVKRTGRD